jgi:hypothetical protein
MLESDRRKWIGKRAYKSDRRNTIRLPPSWLGSTLMKNAGELFITHGLNRETENHPLIEQFSIR